MPLEITAIYENGVLRPEQALPLVEGQKVRVLIQEKLSHARQSAGLIAWKGDPTVLRELAESPEFSILESP